MISNTWKHYKYLSIDTWNITEKFLLTQKIAFYVRIHCNVSVSFPARKCKIALNILVSNIDYEWQPL